MRVQLAINRLRSQGPSSGSHLWSAIRCRWPFKSVFQWKKQICVNLMVWGTAKFEDLKRHADGLSFHKLMVSVIPEGPNMLTRAPSSVWPIQRETKPSQPLGTKNVQNRVPWLGLNTYLLLKVGLSSPELSPPHSLFLYSFIKLIFTDT